MAELSDQELFKQAQAEPPPAEPPPEPVEAPPAEPVTPAAPVTEPPKVEEAVPSWRLREEAEARRVAEDRARALEARLNEVAAHLRQQQPQKQDFFQNPDEATNALIQRALQPFIEENRRQAEEDKRARIYNSQLAAKAFHGADKVDAAEKAFLDAREARTLDEADFERVVGAPNRYDAVVQWHRRQTVLASVGDDPNVWFQKQLEARMADPKFQADLLEKVRAGAATKPGTVKIPPSLSKTTAAASNAPDQTEGDLSDQSLFSFAMRR